MGTVMTFSNICKYVASTLVCSSVVYSNEPRIESIWKESKQEAETSGNDVRLIVYPKYQQAFGHLGTIPASELAYIDDKQDSDNYCRRYYNAIWNLRIAILKNDYQRKVEIISEMCRLLSGEHGLTKVAQPTAPNLLQVYNDLYAQEEKRRKYVRPSRDKVAIVAIAGPHGNSQNYPLIQKVTKELCQKNDKVIVAVTGGIVPKFKIAQGNRGQQYEQEKTVTKEVVKEMREFTFDLLKDPKAQIIFNVGKSDYMYAENLQGFYREIVNSAEARAGRIHIVSNKQSMLRSANFIRPSVQIGDINIFGYCTSNIQKSADDTLVNTEGVNELKDNVKSATRDNKIFVLLAHERPNTLNENVVPAISSYIENIPLRMLFGGGNNGVSEYVNGFQISKWPRPLGYGASIVTILPNSTYPLYGEASFDPTTKKIDIKMDPQAYHSKLHRLKIL